MHILDNSLFSFDFPMYFKISITDIIITKANNLYPHNLIVISLIPAPIILVDKLFLM